MTFYTRFIFHHAHEPENLRTEMYSVEIMFIVTPLQRPHHRGSGRQQDPQLLRAGRHRRRGQGHGEDGRGDEVSCDWWRAVTWPLIGGERSRDLPLVQDPPQRHGPGAAGQAGRLQVRGQGHAGPRGEQSVATHSDNYYKTRQRGSNKQIFIKLNSAQTRTDGDPLADRRGQHRSSDSG